MLYINIILNVLIQEISEELSIQQQYDYTFDLWLCTHDHSEY